MMDSDTSRKQVGHFDDLRQVTVDLFETPDLLLNELFNQALGVPVGEVDCWVQLFSILESLSATESEHDTWQQVHLLNGH